MCSEKLLTPHSETSPAPQNPLLFSQRVLSTYMVECKVSILGITTMVWEGIPHNSTLGPLGVNTSLRAQQTMRILRFRV